MFAPRRTIVLCVTLGALALLAAGCSHAVSSALPPRTNSVKRASIVYRETHAVPPRLGQGSHVSANASYRGDVTTLPANLAFPAGVAYNPASGALYFITGSGEYQLVELAKNGAEIVLASLPFQPTALVYDAATKLVYVTSPYNESGYQYPCVVAVDSSGNMTVLAGGTANGHTDGQGSAATFASLNAITIDAKDGALYVADSDRIRRITTAGAVTTFTPANSISANGLAWSKVDGNFYATDAPEDEIKSITPNAAIKTIAGQCLGGGPSSCAELQRDGAGKKALFAGPEGIAVSPTTGDLYVADFGNNSIREVTPAGLTSTLAGNGLAANVDGAGLNAEFDAPWALTMSGNTLYVADSDLNLQKSAVREVTTTGSTPPPPPTPITYFDTVTPGAEPFAIDSRSTNATTMWYSELTRRVASLTTAGKSTEYTTTSQKPSDTPQDIVLGSDGTPWFYDGAQGLIQHLEANGSIQGFSLQFEICCGAPLWPDSLTYGPDGNVWLIDGSDIDSVTPSGTVTPVKGPSSDSSTIAFGGDGTIWLSGSGSELTQIDRTGKVLATYNVPVNFITEAPDGNILFTQNDAVGEIDIKTRLVTIYPIYEQLPGCQPSQCSRYIGTITTGSDGAWWFTEGIGYIGRLDPNGGFTEYQILAAHAKPFDLVSGPDGNLWFTDTGAQKIGKLALQ